MTTGWVKTGGAWYYLDPETGAMQVGKRTIDGVNYFFVGSGAMATGWVKEGASWYHYGSSGAMTTGWIKPDISWYYLDPETGVMQVGKRTIGYNTYHFDSSGAMRTGWVKEGSNWCCYGTTGILQKNTWISGKYWVDADGIMTASK